MVSPTSLQSASSQASSRLSEASARLRNTRTAVAKPALAAKQTEQKRKRSIEIEVNCLEMDMRQKQLELELVKLEAEKDVAETKERTEVAKLEAKLAENEYSELMFNANSSSHHGRVPQGLVFGKTSSTSSLTRFQLCSCERIHFQLCLRKPPCFQPCLRFDLHPHAQSCEPRLQRFQRHSHMLVCLTSRPHKLPCFHPLPCKFLDCQRRLHTSFHFQLGLQ